MEVKYNSTKQLKESEIQDLWSIIGTENLENDNFIGMLGNTEEHKQVIKFLCSVTPNIIDSDIIQLCLLANLIVEYNYLNNQLEELKEDLQMYIKTMKIKNEVATKIDAISRNYGLTPSTRSKITPIFKDEVEEE
ncbi:Uncharacterised protein [[Clostridium] sordellii]|uniref:hypothetical protein n=1 Tax=Peptostreptococcaceae TaxID=186804 RepID=UPI0005DF9A64|nr:hypothetical protein [Paeniclostridium sordellii]CEN25152.1 Uncharacterised protein [[Clostridium] sordellii] [Paeniclostridium sordellii]